MRFGSESRRGLTAARGAIAQERGQSTIEWIGLVLLVSGVVAVLGAIAGIGVPGTALAQAIASKIACVAGLDDGCGGEVRESELLLAYGLELARLLADHVPDLLYEEGLAELPVDFRECRKDRCSLAVEESGPSSRTVAGLPATAFTRVIDCRAQALERSEAAGSECSGDAAGKTYLQYWLYFPDSQTEPFGERGYHADDWESFQVRIGGGETLARASSHHSYNHDGGVDNWPSDAGIKTKSGWGRFEPAHHVAAGSHAGHVAGDRDEPRYTPAPSLQLVSIEEIVGSVDDEFAVTPPWEKAVYSDPEAEGTG